MALRTALTFSIFWVCALAFGGPYSNFANAIRPLSSPDAVHAAFTKSKIDDDQLHEFMASLLGATGEKRTRALQALKAYVDTRAAAEGYGNDRLAAKQAAEIKRSPLYRDEKVQDANWFEKAAEDFINLIGRLFKSSPAKQSSSIGEAPSILGPWLIYGMWGLLAALVAVFAYVILKHARWRLQLKRRTKAMLEEDEPERTLDEWLARADELERQGLHREAVRCLYLACLLKFDEARIAKFDRGQTNWEHLHRIQLSPLLPPDLDFQATTLAFDRIWYGMRTEGKTDVEKFRRSYLAIADRLMAKAA